MIHVPPEGPRDAECVLVGRDPGWQEVAKGRPFVGDAGRLLDECLGEAGLPRSNLLITNVVDVRPPGDDWEQHEPRDVLRGTEELHALLAEHPRKLIVALGAHALWACTQGAPMTEPGVLDHWFERIFGAKITELRGYVWPGIAAQQTVGSEFDTGGTPVLAMLHPAGVLREWMPGRATLTWDLQKARRLLSGPLAASRRESRWCDSLLQAHAVAVKLRGAPRLAVDIEEGSGHIACVAFAASAEEGWCMVMPRDRGPIEGLLGSALPKVFHNGQYDVTMLTREGLIVNNWADDTMLLWHSVEPLVAGKALGTGRSEKSLRFLASVLTDEPWWKDYGFQHDEEKWRLCATDARVTFEVWEKLQSRL